MKSFFTIGALVVISAFILRADAYPTFNAQRPDGVLPANNCWTLTVSPDKVLTLPADAKSGCTKAPEPNTTYLSSRAILLSNIKANTEALFKSTFLLTSPGGATYEVTVPPAKDEPKKPKLDSGQTATLNQNDAKWITFTGTGLAAIKAAKIDAVVLEQRFTAGKTEADKDKLQLFVPRSVSGKSGDLDITFYDDSQKVLDTASIKVTCTTCKAKTEKR